MEEFITSYKPRQGPAHNEACLTVICCWDRHAWKKWNDAQAQESWADVVKKIMVLTEMLQNNFFLVASPLYINTNSGK